MLPSPHQTIDQAQELGTLINGDQALALGKIGDTPALGSEVDWYRFTLSQASQVSIVAQNPSGSGQPNVALSLYNDTTGEYGDPFNLQGHRLLAQSEASSNGSELTLDQKLAMGSYFVAVSGRGNLDFNPFLVGSGYPGQTGDYELVVSDHSLKLTATDGPAVLNSNPQTNSNLTSSPLILRVSLSSPLDPSTISPDDTVQLVESTDGVFGNSDDVSVALNMLNFSVGANELQLIPVAPLAPGHYRISLSGDQRLHANVLTDLNGIPFGATATNPTGQDTFINFNVTGIEGNTGSAATADDSAATAHNLGNVVNDGVVHIAGVIGDDPFYNPNVDPSLNPANDVDMYHFQVTGSGRYSLNAEVFAGRIGSPLDPGVSLFRLNPATGLVEFVAGNNNTYNSTVDSTGDNMPLFSDAALFAGLTAGDYYVAVSSSFNTPSPAEQQMPGSDGMFNPNVSHSGQLGMNTGSYELNLQVTADSTAPTVISTTPSATGLLTKSPEQLTVQFSEPVNLQQLAFDAYRQETQSDVSSVFIQTPDGTRVYPRLTSFDPTTNQATFLLLDRLPDGNNELHLSGQLGLTDLAGNALTGNSVGGDYVVPINVNSAIHPNGASGKLTDWAFGDSNSHPGQITNLGTLFPHEFQSGINLSRSTSATQSGGSDEYQFTVIQNQDYQFTVGGQHLPAGAHLSLLDLQGHPVPSLNPDARTVLATDLPAGTYILRVSGWNPSHPQDHNYQIHLTILNNSDNPPPLTSGPAPAMQLRLAGTPAPAVTTDPVDSIDRTVASAGVPQVIVPSSNRGTSIPTFTLATYSRGESTSVPAQPSSWVKTGNDGINVFTATARTSNLSDSTSTSNRIGITPRLNSNGSTGELDGLKDPLIGRATDDVTPSDTVSDSSAVDLSNSTAAIEFGRDPQESGISSDQRMNIVFAGISDTGLLANSPAISQASDGPVQSGSLSNQFAWLTAALAAIGSLYRRRQSRRCEQNSTPNAELQYTNIGPVRPAGRPDNSKDST